MERAGAGNCRAGPDLLKSGIGRQSDAAGADGPAVTGRQSHQLSGLGDGGAVPGRQDATVAAGYGQL